MQQKIISLFTIGSILLLAGPIGASPNLATGTLTTSGTTLTLLLPPSADNSPVISLGTAVDPASGRLVEGYAIIHYRPGYVRPSAAKPGGTACYGYLAKWAKWKTVESWVVNPANTRNLAGDFVFSNLTSDIAKWEDAADGIIGNSAGVDILGNGAATDAILAADTVSPDNANEVYFANISTANAIAVTIVWGIFSGPGWARELVEWDQIYDDVDFDWSSSGQAGKMDFENIATHELGHSVGLADLYNSACSEETMYGYAAYGETKKRDLNSGDIAGVNALY